MNTLNDIKQGRHKIDNTVLNRDGWKGVIMNEEKRKLFCQSKKKKKGSRNLNEN